MSFAGKTYWLIGASEGLGRALALEMGKDGAALIVSARNEERLKALLREIPTGSRALPLDVADKEAVEAAIEELGDVDGVIYAAGTYWPLSSQTWEPENVETMIQTNFLGAARCLGPIVKIFAGKNAGHIVIIGSLSGFRGLPKAIGYGASKAALMHLAENIHADLYRTNVKVQLINPGFIKTRLTDKNEFAMPFIISAGQAATKVKNAMASNRFQTNFPRLFSSVFLFFRILPSFLYFKIVGSKDRR